MRSLSRLTLPDVLPGSVALIQGSFRGSLVLIGPPGSGKSVYCKQFLCNAVESGDSGVYFSTSESVAKVEEGMALLGFDVDRFLKSGLLHLVDIQPTIGDRPTRRKRSGISGWLRGPDDTQSSLVDVEGVFEDALTGLGKPAVVLDSLTTLLLRSNESELLRIVQSLLARLKSLGAFSIFSLTSGNYSEHFVDVLRSLFDGVLELKVDESSGGLKRLLRVFSLKGTQHTTDWVRFSISDRGISIEEPLKTRCAMCSRPLGAEPFTFEVSGEMLHFDSRDCLLTYRKLKGVHGDIFR